MALLILTQGNSAIIVSTMNGIIGERIWQLTCSICYTIRELHNDVLFCSVCDTDIGANLDKIGESCVE